MEPDKSAAGENDVEKLREALATERRSRAWLESRLEELDQRLRRSQAAERALQNAGAQDQIAVLGLHASLTAEAAKESIREELDLWLQVAALHAEALPEPLTSAPVSRAEPLQIVREPAADPRYEEKLAAARAAMETAEARAAHQATQMRRLSEELAASRAEQMRALNRIQELEKKLLRIEAQADLLDSAVSVRVVDKGAPEFELPAETMAPLTPAKPGLVYTETAEGTLLAPAEPGEDTPGLSLDEFEPKPYGQAAKPVESDQEDIGLEDALTELFGDQSAEMEPHAPAPEPEPAAAASVDALADALEIWGGGPEVSIDPPSAPEPASETSVAEESTAADADPFSELASALESLSSAPIEPEHAEEAPAPSAVDEDPFGGLMEAMAEFGDVDDAAATNEPEDAEGAEALEDVATADVETLVADATVVEPRPDAPEAEDGGHSGETLFDALEQAADERKSNRRGRPAPAPAPSEAPERMAAMAESLSAWSGEPADNGGEKNAPPKGRAAMVDALIRFMGPQ